METIVFPDKAHMPGEPGLKKALGKTYLIWQKVCDLVYAKVPGATSEWNFPGVKYGWNFRIKNKKRIIIYFLPGPGFFRVAFVFGERAYQEIMLSSLPAEIKNSLTSAKVYAEGRGMRIDVNNEDVIPEICRLVEIKLAH